VRRGRVFKRCTKCGRPAGTDRHAARCHDRRFTWAYQVDVSPRGAPRKQKIKGGFKTKAEAVDKLADLQSALKRNTYVEPSKVTLGEYLERHWLPSVKGDVRPSTFAAYEMHARLYLGPGLGEIPLQALTRQAIRALYLRLAQEGGKRGPLSPKTVHNIHLTLHTALAAAVEDRLLQHNPADGAHKLPKDRPEMKVWSPEEIRAFLESVASDRLFALWRLALTTGMRRGELLGLRDIDLDLEAAELRIVQTRIKTGAGVAYGQPKTEKGRRPIALDDVTVAALRRYLRVRAEERLAWGPGYVDEGLVFCRENGSPLDPDVASQRFERLARGADLPRIPFHGLRHSYATAALRAGVAIAIVSRRVGHASPSITMNVYQHVIPGMDQDAADRIAGILDA
jgi:integrase